MNFFTFKFSIVFLFITLPVFAYFAWTTFGGTQVGVSIQPAGTLQTGLVGWWTFDGPNLQQNVADSSGQGNTGYFSTTTSATTTVVGKLGQALSFDGVDDYVDAGSGNVASIIGPITISAWIKTSSTTAQTIVGTQSTANRGYQFFLRGAAC